jgi:hypothetical protein
MATKCDVGVAVICFGEDAHLDGSSSLDVLECLFVDNAIPLIMSEVGDEVSASFSNCHFEKTELAAVAGVQKVAIVSCSFAGAVPAPVPSGYAFAGTQVGNAECTLELGIYGTLEPDFLEPCLADWNGGDWKIAVIPLAIGLGIAVPNIIVQILCTCCRGRGAQWCSFMTALALNFGHGSMIYMIYGMAQGIDFWSDQLVWAFIFFLSFYSAWVAALIGMGLVERCDWCEHCKTCECCERRPCGCIDDVCCRCRRLPLSPEETVTTIAMNERLPPVLNVSAIISHEESREVESHLVSTSHEEEVTRLVIVPTPMRKEWYVDGVYKGGYDYTSHSLELQTTRETRTTFYTVKRCSEWKRVDEGGGHFTAQERAGLKEKIETETRMADHVVYNVNSGLFGSWENGTGPLTLKKSGDIHFGVDHRLQVDGPLKKQLDAHVEKVRAQLLPKYPNETLTVGWHATVPEFTYNIKGATSTRYACSEFNCGFALLWLLLFPIGWNPMLEAALKPLPESDAQSLYVIKRLALGTNLRAAPGVRDQSDPIEIEGGGHAPAPGRKVQVEDMSDDGP